MYKLLLSNRYLRTRFIALASVISVMLGVATMIVVNSVMAGFSSQMRERIHGLLADVVVETHSYDGVADPDLQMAIANQAAGDLIEAMTPTVEIYGMLSFNYAGQWITRPITLIGIDPEGKSKVGPLKDFLDSYHPVVKDGKIERDALRKPGEEPNWELTETALEYRKERVARQQWYEQQVDAADPLDEIVADAMAGSDTEKSDTEKTESETETPPVAWDVVAETTDGEETPSKPATVDQPQLDATEEVASDNSSDEPAIDLENPFAVADEEPVDPAASMDGRLYVGIGLVSFPYKDPETNETKTMMMAQPGDDVKISTVTSGRPPQPAHFNATIVDVFKSGMSEYDANLVFCNLEELQKVRGMLVEQTDMRSITSLQIKLKDYRNAGEAVERLKAAFPASQFSVKTWEQKQGPLLAAVEVESAILNVLLFLIIAVAGFGILAIFYMIVVEKTRDIGILKALGASAGGIMSIFLTYGLALGMVGSGVGVVLGLLFVRHINFIESCLTVVTGRKVFDEAIYYFPEIPTQVNPLMVCWVAAGAILIAVLASVLPARRASRMHPVQALRYDA